MQFKSLSFAVAKALSISAVFAASPLSQSQEVEEVIVSADLLNRSHFEIASSITVVNDALIQQKAATHFEDIINLAPNVNFSSGASRGRFFQIRGIGERSQFVEPLNPSVGLIIDGIDFTGVGGAATTLDVEQVEILRGPQGTLFGANALAGLINFKSHDPGNDVFAKVSAEAANFDSHRLSGVFSTPINDTLGFRVSAEKVQSDGHIEDAFLGRDDTNNIDEFTAKSKWVYTPSEDLSIKLSTVFLDIDNGYETFSLDNTRTTLSDQPGHDRLETLAGSLDIEWAAFDFADVQVLAAYADNETEYGFDVDWSFRTICAIDDDCAFFQYSQFDNFERENSNANIDVRLNSNQDGAINWTAGIYIRDQEEDLDRTTTDNDPNFDTFFGPIVNPLITEFQSTNEVQTAAIYGQVAFSLSENVILDVGARIENRENDFEDSTGFNASTDENFLGGNVSLEYHGFEDALVYAKIARGFKAGGFNSVADLPENLREFNDETLLNYELGYKFFGLDKRLSGQVVAFYQDRKDIQVRQSFVTSQATGLPFDGTNNPCPCDFSDYLDNAAEGNNYGLEVELSYWMNDSVNLWTNVGLLETEFENFQSFSHVDADPGNGLAIDLSGREQAHAPNYQYALGASYEFIDGYTWYIDIEGKDDFLLSTRHDVRSNKYTLLNSRFEYQQGALTLAIWGKNLTDKDVIVRGFGSFGNDPRNFYQTEPYFEFGAPRTYGATVSYAFN